MATEISFDSGGCRIQAQAWGDPGGHRVLALHGWLDNSASFAPLAGLLDGCYLIAPDLVGHGRSDHRQTSGPYHLFDDIRDIFALADQLQWQEFSLLGHSRGGIISTLAAGTFPERIRRLILIEGIFPEPLAAGMAPEQLANAINTLRYLSGRPLNTFSSPEAAVRARQRGMFPLGEEAARLLVERGIRPVDGGYQWSTDQNLLAPSTFKLTREQVAAFMRRIQAPVDLLLGDQGVTVQFEHLLADLQHFPEVRQHHFCGGHHLHMEEAVDGIAAVINHLLQDPPTAQ